MGDGQYPNGDKLAATREDMARFEGKVLTELKNLTSSINRVESSTKQITNQYENLEDRVEVLEEQKRFEEQMGERSINKSERSRLQRMELRSWVGAIVAVVLAIIDIFGVLGHHKP